MHAQWARLVAAPFLTLSFLCIPSVSLMMNGGLALASFGQGLPKTPKQSSQPNKKGLIDDLADVKQRINLILRAPWPTEPERALDFFYFLRLNNILTTLLSDEFHVPKYLRVEFNNQIQALRASKIDPYNNLSDVMHFSSDAQRILTVKEIQTILEDYTSYLQAVYHLLDGIIHYD